MQIDSGIQWVWLDHPGEAFNLAAIILVLSAMMSRFFNHYSAKGEERPVAQKLRNTWKFSAALIIVWFWAVRLDFLHGQFERIGIKNVLFASALVLIVAGDWLGFILWSMANYHNMGNGRSGWRGWLVDGRDKVLVWLKRTAIAIKDRLPGNARKALALFVLAMTLACVSVVVTNTPKPVIDGPQGTASALNATYDAWATQTAEPTPTSSPTVTPTPTSSIVELPTLATGTYVYEVPLADTGVLARLCVVEVRGMAERRAEACASVVSTVFARMERRYLSDGTVAGTIAWNCFPGALECQFPAYALHGCDGIIPTACPHNYPQDIAFFQRVVEDYLRGRIFGQVCLGYLYYGLKDFDMVDCVIEADNGQAEGFHNS